MRKTVLVIFSCFLSLLFVPKTYGQGQDKLLGLLKEELAQQMKELKGEEFPPYHMNYRVIDVTSSVVSASFAESVHIQKRYQSRMVNMCMCKQYIIYVRCRNRQFLILINIIALFHATIDKDKKHNIISAVTYYESV